MSRLRCSYFLCGKGGKKTPGLRKFSFPVNDPSRCKEWIVNSGNPELLSLSAKKLKFRFLCGDHFRKEDFLSKKLTSTAIPTKYTLRKGEPKQYGSVPNFESIPSTSSAHGIHLLTPEKRKSPPLHTTGLESDSFLKDITNFPLGDSPEKRGLKRKLAEANKKLVNLHSKLKKQKMTTVPRDLNMLPPYSRTLVKMQLFHKAKSPWLSDEKNTALSLYYKSPSTYKFLRSKGVILPSPSTISQWLTVFSYRPGINKRLFHCLKLKIETLSENNRQCILTFDEMAIKQCLEFSRAKSTIEGFEDLGHLGRKPVFAKQALVLLVRGLYSAWKIPVSFYFSANGVKTDELADILKKNLHILKSVGLNVLAVVCDQATTNQKLYKSWNVSIERPYFELDGSLYFAIFDVPHLMKSMRNNLLDGDFLWGNKQVSFKDIEAIYNLDLMSKTGRVLPKLNDMHLHPGAFQKMNVRLAVQVVSHSVSAAIKSGIETGELKSVSVQNTADFVNIIDRVFDTLNSRKLKGKNMYNSAISNKNSHIMKTLDEAEEVLGSLKKISKEGKLKVPPCFNGFRQSINAVKMIFQQQHKKGYRFLLTARLNQDILENQFSIYRQRGGYTRNPTVRMFQASFKSNCIMNLMKPPKTGNTEPSHERNLILEATEVVSENYFESPTEYYFESSAENESSSSSNIESENIQQDDEVSLEECSTLYLAGYLIKKCLKLYSCDHCNYNLQSDKGLSDDKDIFIFYKNYNLSDPSLLKKPTALLFKVTKVSMIFFSKYFKSYWHKRCYFKVLLKKVQNQLGKKVPGWFECPTKCEKHRNYILNLLLRTLIYKECKKYSSSVKILQKKSEKLEILKHV